MNGLLVSRILPVPITTTAHHHHLDAHSNTGNYLSGEHPLIFRGAGVQ